MILVDYKGIKQKAEGKVIDTFEFNSKIYVRIAAFVNLNGEKEEAIFNFVADCPNRELKQTSYLLVSSENYVPMKEGELT